MKNNLNITKEHTWLEIIAIEPGLKDLFIEAQNEKDPGNTPGYCANNIWYRKYKPRLVDLVGYCGVNLEIASEFDYGTAYRKIYNQLPGCRNCQCC